MYTKALFSILCTSLCMDVSMAQSGQNAPPAKSIAIDTVDHFDAHLTLRAHYDGSTVRLRWAPDAPSGWLNANVQGYHVERLDLGLEGDTAAVANAAFIALAPTALKPLDIPGWRALHDQLPTDNYVMVAGEMIHEALQPENMGLKNGDFLGSSNTFQERMGFALLSADMSWPAAKGSALGTEDPAVVKGHGYLYRVWCAANPAVVRMDTAYVVLSTAKAQEIPRPIITEVMERDHTIVLNWPRSAHEKIYTAYDIERSDDGGKTFFKVNKQPYIHFTNPDLPQRKDLITYTDSVPRQYVLYHYRLIGHTPFGITGPPSDAIKAMARDKTAPPSPGNVKAAEKKAGETTLTWDYPPDVKDLKGFHVVRGGTVSAPNTALTKDMLPKNARTFTDRSPEVHKHNYYMVVAVDTAGNPGLSLAALGDVMDSVPPAPPVGVVGRIDTSGVVHISWRLGKEPDLYGYYVYFRNAKNHIEARVNGQPLRDTVFTDTISMHTLTESIWYRVVAIDMNENQSRSKELLELHRPDMRPPSAPLFTDYRVSAKGIQLQWVPSSSEDVVAHYLLRRSKRTQPWDTLLVVPKASAKREYLDPDKGHAAVYEYAIRAKDDAGLFSEPVNGLRLRMMSMDTPEKVKDLSAHFDPQKRSNVLTWSYAQREGVRFSILRSSAHGTFTEVKRLPSTARSWSDTLLKTGIEYDYTIQVVEDSGVSSDYSAHAVVKL